MSTAKQQQGRQTEEQNNIDSIKRIVHEYIINDSFIKKKRKEIEESKHKKNNNEKMLISLMRKIKNNKISDDKGNIIEIRQKNSKRSITPQLIESALLEHHVKDSTGKKLIIGIDEIIQLIEKKRSETIITPLLITQTLTGVYPDDIISKIVNLITGQKKNKSTITIPLIHQALKGLFKESDIEKISTLISKAQPIQQFQTLVFKTDKNADSLKLT